jgi:hypothetical protein
MKRTIEEGPYPHHKNGCKERYNKPALYCDACHKETQMTFLISDKAKEEAQEESREENAKGNLHPERGVPLEKCVCGLLYDYIEWESDSLVKLSCSDCGDVSKQKCSKDFISRGYKWR